MMKSLLNPSQVHERPLISRLAIVGALSILGLLSGLPSGVNRYTSLGLDSAAYAQSNPVTQYARAAYEIERLRQSKYAEAKRIMGGTVPDDVCRQSNIPQPVRDICTELMDASADIIKRNGLSGRQFNDLTRQRETDPVLQQQIQAELLRLQKESP